MCWFFCLFSFQSCACYLSSCIFIIILNVTCFSSLILIFLSLFPFSLLPLSFFLLFSLPSSFPFLPPSSPSLLSLLSLPPSLLYVACAINVHQRCQQFVAHSCGIDQVSLAKMMSQMGVSADQLNSSVRLRQHVHVHCTYTYICTCTCSTCIYMWCTVCIITWMLIVGVYLAVGRFYFDDVAIWVWACMQAVMESMVLFLSSKSLLMILVYFIQYITGIDAINYDSWLAIFSLLCTSNILSLLVL